MSSSSNHGRRRYRRASAQTTTSESGVERAFVVVDVVESVEDDVGGDGERAKMRIDMALGMPRPI